MSKIFVVARYEFINTLKRRAVLFVMFGLPLLLILVTAGLNLIANVQREGEDEANSSNLFSALVSNPDEAFKPSGLVDESGLLTEMPEAARQLFVVFPDTNAAAAAFANEEIADYFVVPSTYLEEGQVAYFTPETGLSEANEFREYALYNLLVEAVVPDAEISARVTNPTALVETIDVNEVTTASPDEESFGLAFILGVAITIVFYMTVFGAAAYMLQSLSKEKENRVMEILLSSLRPIDLLVGKIVGLGGIGLLQAAIWITIGLLFASGDNSPLRGLLSNVALPSLPLSTWLLIGGYFLAGYLVYASLFAGLGAIAPNVKEASQAQFIVMLPILLPSWFISIFLNAPNSAFVVALSLIPLTSPLAMPIRLAVTTVPLWQSLGALGVALLTGIGIIFLATRIFQGRTLLSGRSLTIRTAWQAISGRA
jgi:ABC-2 type transport system permease protein